ncbi:LacI family DNA-binding transcriptional regulator [Streptomyces fractus]|uniref:LacI family DNA-binding transcriptional regulator n=1 Tax=Streptomyces fractus TaxID=641806 RepID=UPI003CF6CB78
MARERRVTATDVAREAGVSQPTVSYVLNNVGNQKISAETKARVYAAVAKLGYTPSAAARTLRLGRSNVVLLLLADVPLGHTAIELIEHLTEDLERHGLTVITRIEAGQSTNTLWADVAPRAVVLFAPLDAERRAQMEAVGTHVVNVWHPGLDNGEDDPLARSQSRVGLLQVGHLAGRGHQAIGYGAPTDRRLHDFYELRLEGVRRACVERGLFPPAVREVPLDVVSAAEHARRWVAEGVTAVCAFNDEVAFALLAGMRAAGLSAPDALAVIGVDDIPLAPFAAPPLTTVNQHLATVAAELAESVLHGLEHPNQFPRRQSEVARVVIRESA